MRQRLGGGRRDAWRAIGLGLAAGVLSMHAVAHPGAERALRDEVDVLLDQGFEAPAQSLARLRERARGPGLAPAQHRLLQTAIGLVAADNGMGEDARAAIRQLEGLVPTAGPIAHADALLVRADLELTTQESEKGARDILAAVAAYAPFCDDLPGGASGAGPSAGGGACDVIDWFWANMFAGLAFSDKETRASAGIYLQAARGIAERAGRPELEARAVAISAALTQDEGNVELSDRLLQRADALAVRSANASAQEFVKMFSSQVLQERGDLPHALLRLQEALEIATRAGHARRIMNLSDGLVRIDLKQDHPGRALQRIAEALPKAVSWREQGMVDALRVHEIVALLRLRRLDDARRRLGPLLDSLDARLRPAERGDQINELGDAFVAAAAMDDAVALFQREQKAVLAAGDKPFERAMLARQAAVAADHERQRRAEGRRWAVLGGVAAALLLAIGAAIPVLRARNRRLAQDNQALQEQSVHDPLTGLLNRDGLRRGLAPHGSLEAFTGTVLLVDVDHFKHINDALGHAGGDAVLQAVSARLRACVRDHDFVVRWGGEELVIVVLTMPFDADALADRILQSLAGSPIAFQQRAVAVSASIGYGTFPLEDGGAPLSFDEALAIADAGMYHAKRHGRRAAVRITRLPRRLLADLGGLPEAVEREASSGEVGLRVRRLGAPKGIGPMAPSVPEAAHAAR